MDSTWIQRQPYGVALCICTWHYPIYVTITPLCGLLAAGNCVILKPSEVCVHSEKLFTRLLPKYLNEVLNLHKDINQSALPERLPNRIRRFSSNWRNTKGAI